jgi:cephalosporin-C deacetylase
VLADLSGAELLAYRSEQVEPADFDAFWNATIDDARGFDTDVRLEAVRTPVSSIQIFDMTFRGYGGQPIRAWLRRPIGVEGAMPAVVEFVGYGGGRGFAEDSLFWASAGFVHIQMDTRGQGAAWSTGATPDIAVSGPRGPGMMTSGIQDPADYYYRRLITDAVRAVEAAASLPFVDSARITSLGISQGGGVALAVSALAPQVGALAAFVPFLCDFPRAILITDSDPYKEISRYLAVHRDQDARVAETLSYFDGVTFAKRATAPAWFTTGLMDTVCPPSTVVAAYNEYAGPKHITIRNHNGHDHGVDDNVRIATELELLG